MNVNDSTKAAHDVPANAEVGTARCAVRAAFSGATIPPAVSRAGTSRRDVPATVRFMGRADLRSQLQLHRYGLGRVNRHHRLDGRRQTPRAWGRASVRVARARNAKS